MNYFRIAVATLSIFANLALHAAAQPGETHTAEYYSAEGHKALAAGDYQQAEQDFKALNALQPRIAEVHATLAVIYFQERRFDQALAEIKTAQTLKPGLPRLDSLSALSLAELGGYAQALPGLERCFHLGPDPAIKRMCGLQLTRTYTGLHRDDKAVEVSLELDQLYPKDPEILYNTSKIYGNYAYLTIRKLTADAPNSVWRHLAAAEAYESQGSSSEALAEYNNVLAIEPKRPGIHYRMGRTLLRQFHQDGNKATVDQARVEFEQELSLDPRNGNAAYELAEMHRQAGELDAAEQGFRLALEEYKDFEEAQLGLAAVLLARQRPAEALPLVRSAVAGNPNDEVAWYRLAQVEKLLGNRPAQQEAIARFKQLHEEAQGQTMQQPTPAGSDVTKQELGSTPSD